MRNFLLYRTLLVLLVMLSSEKICHAQACTALGQTPSTAFPVCGTTTFTQSQVPICTNREPLFVPCNDGAQYADKNPFYYKFTCFQAGTLGFVITPLAANEDYDWQLYDITGRNPNDIFTNNSLLVTGNWAGVYGPTGASATGVNFIQCSSTPTANVSTFALWPTLIVGHEYLLMISHFTDTQSGYDLSFGGGTAVITDPTLPHLLDAKPGCDGRTLVVRLNKKMRCNSITTAGSEFAISPAVTTVTAAVTDSCAFGFDFDEVTLTLASPLPNGNYQLVAVNGTDNNTLLDICARNIPVGEQVPFVYAAPVPIRADSVGNPPCASDSVKIYYPKKIRCSTITSSGSDFSVTGPAPVTVVSAAGGNCANDLADYIVVKFAQPIVRGGTYTLLVQPGIDGSPVFDLCGQPILPQSLSFTAADTVNADFQFTTVLGCRNNTVTFSHNGANGVNNWNWLFNTTTANTQTHTIQFPATSTNNIQLIVSNGVCRDTSVQTLVMDNEVKAGFTMDNIICPEDALAVTNTSTGSINAWNWQYDVLGNSTLEDPPPFLFPTINREAYYTVKLTVYNTALNCADSTRKTLTVLDHCLIEVPTAFTPNNDGRNDTFSPHNALKANNYSFKVFNRWGQLMFQSNNWQAKWDGRFNGVVQGTGVYVWMLSYTHRDTNQPVFRKGTVTLIK